MAALVLLKGTMRVGNLLESVTGNSDKVGMNSTNLSGITINGSSALIGRWEGFVELMQGRGKIRNNSGMQRCCLVHEEALYATSLEAENIK
jgi:hypothetical protein